MKVKAKGLAKAALLRVKAKLAVMSAKCKAQLAAMWRKSKAVAMSLAVSLSLTLPALATEGGSGSGSSGSLSTIIAATDDVTAMVNKAWAMMTANPLLTFYVASGLLATGIGFFAYLRRVSHH